MPQDHRPCRTQSWRASGRVALNRGSAAHHRLCGDPRPRSQSRAAPRQGRHQAWRAGGDARLEHLAASRSLVWHPWHRRGLPHRQSAALPRPDRLDRQPRRRPRDDDGPHLRAAAGKARRAAAHHQTLHRAHRRRAHAGDRAQERGALRRVDRRGRWRLCLEVVRREHRRRHVLHLRHDRQSEGRRLFAPLERAALDDRQLPRRHGRVVPRRGASGGADVPCQLLGACAHLADAGRRHGDARRQARRRLGVRA